MNLGSRKVRQIDRTAEVERRFSELIPGPGSPVDAAIFEPSVSLFPVAFSDSPDVPFV